MEPRAGVVGLRLIWHAMVAAIWRPHGSGTNPVGGSRSIVINVGDVAAATYYKFATIKIEIVTSE